MKNKCDKDCSTCLEMQQRYCSAQMVCNMQDVLEEIRNALNELSKRGCGQLINIDNKTDIVNEKAQE